MTKPHYRYEFGGFDERLEHFCALFEIDPPEIVYEDGEPTLTDPLMEWIKQNNANMDWLFAGSPSAILREWMDTSAKERKFVQSCSRLEPEVQAGLLAMMTAVIEHKLPIDEPLEIFGQLMKNYRAARLADPKKV